MYYTQLLRRNSYLKHKRLHILLTNDLNYASVPDKFGIAGRMIRWVTRGTALKSGCAMLFP